MCAGRGSVEGRKRTLFFVDSLLVPGPLLTLSLFHLVIPFHHPVVGQVLEECVLADIAAGRERTYFEGVDSGAVRFPIYMWFPCVV